MAKLVDAPHSKCGEAAPHVGSSPTPPIKMTKTKTLHYPSCSTSLGTKNKGNKA